MAMSRWIEDPALAGPIRGMLDAIGVILDVMIVRRVIDETMLATLLEDAAKSRLVKETSQEAVDAASILGALAQLLSEPDRVEARLKALSVPQTRGTA
jgi:hypothetical protein